MIPKIQTSVRLSDYERDLLKTIAERRRLPSKSAVMVQLILEEAKRLGIK